ncbi:MAG: hypothetical protein JKY23_04240 [Nitrospinaceae bacterium]|nr:hypothetical protein [Nitrospinaceae bacterium]
MFEYGFTSVRTVPSGLVTVRAGSKHIWKLRWSIAPTRLGPTACSVVNCWFHIHVANVPEVGTVCSFVTGYVTDGTRPCPSVPRTNPAQHHTHHSRIAHVYMNVSATHFPAPIDTYKCVHSLVTMSIRWTPPLSGESVI